MILPQLRRALKTQYLKSCSYIVTTPHRSFVKMPSTDASSDPIVPKDELEAFQRYLSRSTRILALLGAGLSASSGLPTFRGAGGLWRTHEATDLATPEAFNRDPGLVWQFYNYRRHMALNVKPNRAHYALAEFARRNKNFMTISQNVDGLSPRANHPPEQLKLLHGSLFDVKCSEFFCNYVEANNFTDPVVPALAPPSNDIDPTTNEARQHVAQEPDIADENVALPEIAIKDLPHCPKCKRGLLRPGVVWFGEMLPSDVMNDIDAFIESPEPIDLMLVIGTSSKVFPAAGFVDEARAAGARVAVVNMEESDTPPGGLEEDDWFFKGDAAQIVPELLKSVIGEIGEDGTVR
jgi:NAD-dependent SIR2 family protein deacetylase